MRLLKAIGISMLIFGGTGLLYQVLIWWSQLSPSIKLVAAVIVSFLSVTALVYMILAETAYRQSEQ